MLVISAMLVLYHGVAGQSLNADKPGIEMKRGRPDIPGDLGFDLGLAIAPDFPEQISQDIVRSIYFSPFYKYEFFIPNTNFSILAGLSVGSEKYRFKNDVTLVRSIDAEDNYFNEVVELDSLLENVNIKKSNLTATYLEIPLEVRFRTNRKYPKNGLNFSVGGKIGYLADAHTKFKYRVDGETKVTKQKESFDLSPLRYGLTGRIGFGIFNLFYYYSLNPLFQEDKGPLGDVSQPMIFGFSLSPF